jgi:hypothetical protein
MANHTTRLTAKQEAALVLIVAKSNAEKKAADPLFVDETADAYWDRIVLTVADSYVEQADADELATLTASFKAANQAKRDAAKAALQ